MYGDFFEAKQNLWGFGSHSVEGKSYAIMMPHWFAVLAAATLAALPWLPFKRFSLRTLLIAITAVALVLGLAVWLL